mgnify:CR=1 FL=1
MLRLYLIHKECQSHRENSVFFFQAEDGIRDQGRSRGLGDVYKGQAVPLAAQAADGKHRVGHAAPRPIAVAEGQEARLQERLEHLQHGALQDAVGHRGLALIHT